MQDKAILKFANIAIDIARVSPMALATSYGNTLSAPDGGYAVPVDAAELILAPAVGALLPLCRQLPVTVGGSLELPLDLATPYSETGIIADWDIEGNVLPQRKPNLDLTNFILKKLTVLVPVTDELLEDSAALAAYLPIALQTATTRKVNDAIISGLGAGRPLGILNSSATITVAKEASQLAGTLVDGNITTMLERSLNPDQSRWIANPALYGKIIQLSAWDGATRTLAGLPVTLTDSCPAANQPGDIILADMAGYLMAMKTPSLNQSAHLWFDQDMTAFRFTFRADGMPMLVQPITPPNSSVTKSHFITIEARA